MSTRVSNITSGQDDAKNEQLSTLYSHIRNLSTIDKGLILLFLEGKSHDDIATITGFTKTNVGTRISRIKEKLKAQIKQS